MQKQIQYAGEFFIKELKIHTSSGRVIDFTESDSVLGFEIYEDIFSTALTGSLLIIDVDNISENGPIIGQEFLTLKFGTPTLDEFDASFTFNITKVASKLDATKNAQVLTLNFIAPEIIRNQRVRVSKSYTDTISNIIQDVLKDSRYINTKKKIFIQETSGIRKVVSPNFHPYKFINNLTNEAISISGSQNFVFYENIKGIHFETLDRIMESDTVGDYSMGDVGTVDGKGGDKGKVVDVEKDFAKPMEMAIISNNDILLNTMSGMLGSKIIKYDIYNKRYEVNRYGYFSDFEENRTIAPNPVYNNNSIDEFGNNIGMFSDSRIYLQPTSISGTDVNQTNETSSYSYAQNGLTNKLLQRRAKITELNSGINIALKVNGNTTIAVGEPINIKLPVTGRIHEGGEFDSYYSGKYIITKLKHQFDTVNKRHIIEMNAAKDSITPKLPNDSEATEPSSGSAEVYTVG